MAKNKPIPVLLIKTKSSPNDLYEECFRSSRSTRYEPSFIPCLSHEILTHAVFQIQELIVGGSFTSHFAQSGTRFQRTVTHLEELVLGRSFLGTDDEPVLVNPTYGGIIFTSQRAVEAFGEVINNINSESPPPLFKLDESTILYVVGPATFRALKALNLPCPIRGAETGNGEALAQYILDDFKTNEIWKTSKKKPGLLFLVGEQRRDIIPRTLQSDSLPEEQRIKVDEIEVYKTIEHPDFGTKFSEEWEKNGGKDTKQWVVVFSPSGCGTILKTLGMLNPKGKFLKDGTENGLTKIVTIGPTTKDYLEKEFGFTPHTVAETPTPEGVKDAIEAFKE